MLSAALVTMLNEAADRRAIEAYVNSLLGQEQSDDEARLADEMRATLEVMFLMAASDGDVAEDELMQLSACLRAMLEPFEQQGDASMTLPLLRLNETVEQFATALERDGMEGRFAAVNAALQSPKARQLAFMLAAAIAFVDDFVASGEADLIDKFALALELDPEESQGLLRRVHSLLDA